MRRRSFLGGLSAMVAGLFGCSKAAPGEVDRVVSLEEAIREAKKEAWRVLPGTSYGPATQLRRVTGIRGLRYVDARQVARSRAEFARGAYEDAAELLRRAEAGEPL